MYGCETEIWYVKESNRDLCMGYDWCEGKNVLPNPNDLQATHILLCKVADTDLNRIYRNFQTEIWSPEGEAVPVIESKGLLHTSISVGDIIKIGTNCWMVDIVGFKKL